MFDSRRQHQAKSQSSMLVCLVVILLIPSEAVAFIAGPSRIHSSSKTMLKNKPTHSDYSDFASYGAEQEEEAQQLAKEFYEELRLRKARRSVVSDVESKNLDTNDVLRTRPSSSSDGRSKTFFTSPSTPNPSPQFAFFSLPSFLTSAPSPPSSAGLFSGSGQTAYSSGRSLRAEVQLLESSINKQENSAPGIIGWNGVYIDRNHDQLEQLLKAAAGTLILLSVTYLAVELAGGLAIVFPWEEALFKPMTDGIVKDGISTFLVVLGDGVEHVGGVVVGDAAWIMEESSALVCSMGQTMARSMEGLVLR